MGTVDFTSSRTWIDTITKKLEGFVTVNSVKTWDICTKNILQILL